MAPLQMHKLEAARRQIKSACDLYLSNGDLISVLTLAGAAEEVCGNLLKRAGKPNMLGIMFAEAQSRGLTLTRKDLYSRASKVRNALKHAESESEDTFDFDAAEAALMLLRAVVNYQLCGERLPAEAEEFVNWVREHGLLRSGA
jgi:hypothetical protein